MTHLTQVQIARRAVGRTSPKDGEVSAHLETCAECRQKVAEYQQELDQNSEERTVPGGASPSSARQPTRPPEESTHPGDEPQATRPLPAMGKLDVVPGDLHADPEPDTPDEVSVAQPRPEMARGTNIGRYLVLHRLGEGGMGVVYAAYDSELDRKVAVKLLRVVSAKKEKIADGQARLLREAQAMARISHPNVISVFDVGTHEDAVFVAMEFVDGGTLKHWMQEKERTWQETLKIFLEAGKGLAAAHAVGLVHRDFKPDNVLVSRDGRVFVTDFGLARLMEDGSSSSSEQAKGPRSPSSPGSISGEFSGEQSPVSPDEASSRLAEPLTQVGTVMGTPQYMPPEQHRGDPTDSRSDQFSFAAALYWALWRKRPFDVQKLKAAAAEPDEEMEATAVGRRKANTRRNKVSAVRNVIREPPKEPKVPTWVKKPILKALSLNPEDRHPSMEALLSQLSRDRAGVRRRYLVAAALLGVLATGLSLWRSHQVATGQLCTGAEKQLVGVWDAKAAEQLAKAFEATGAPNAADQAQRVSHTLDGWAQSWTAMHTDTCKATRIRGEQTEQVMALRMSCLNRRLKELDALVRLLESPDPKVVNKSLDAVQSLSSVRACADVDALTNKAPLPDDPKARAAIEKLEEELAHVRALRSTGKYPAALEKAQQVIAAAEPLEYRPLNAEALYLKGWLEDLTGAPKQGEDTLRMAINEADAGRDDPTRLQAAARLVLNVGYKQGRADDGAKWEQAAQATLTRIGGNPELEADLLNNMGATRYKAGKYAEALETYQRGLAVVEHSLGKADPRRANLVANIGSIQYKLGQRQKAVETLQLAIELLEKQRGDNHPNLVYPHTNLASAFMDLGDYEPARLHVEKALHIAKLGGNDSVLADVLDCKATLLHEMGNDEEALELFRQTLAMKEKAESPNDIKSFSYDGIGQSLLAMGKAREAVQYLEKALELAGTDPYFGAQTRFSLAKALWETHHDGERARALAAQAKSAFNAVNWPERANRVDQWVTSALR